MSEKSKLIYKDTIEKSYKRYGSVGHKYTLLDSVPNTYFTKKQCCLVSLALTIVIITFSVTLILGLPRLREKRNKYYSGDFPVSNTEEFIYSNAAIVADGEPCADIGKNILLANGSAVDAAIAMVFCDEIANPQSLGLGGGFFMIVYIRETKTSEVIDARETAPLRIDKNMFDNNATLLDSGGLAIAVPGQLKGLFEAHQKYGKLNWSALVEPSIKLASNGIVVNSYLEKIFLDVQNEIMNEPTLNDTFVNKHTGSLYKLGDILKRPKLAKTLEIIATTGDTEFYNGSIGLDLVNDINDLGGLLTMEDLQNYKVISRKTINVPIVKGNFTLLTTPPPSSGPVLAYILNILDSLDMKCIESDQIEERAYMFHRFIETLKYAFAKRSQLADPNFNDNSQILKEMTSQEYASLTASKITDEVQNILAYGTNVNQVLNEGTGHLAVISANGDAVAVTSTINSLFGAKRLSNSTGIILNNEMKDFSITTDPSILDPSVNSMSGGKRPLSSMSPSIIVDRNGDPKMVIGAIGGTRIIPAMAQVLYNVFWQCHTLKEATDQLRLFYDFTSDHVLFEAQFPKVFRDMLFRFGHRLAVDSQTSSVYSILKDDNNYFHTLVDHRKGGSSQGL